LFWKLSRQWAEGTIKMPDEQRIRELEARLARLENRTDLIEERFWIRALAVWWHWFVVNTIIAGSMLVLYFLISQFR
jgi:hypothetical protein